jgi:hypothetical protein
MYTLWALTIILYLNISFFSFLISKIVLDPRHAGLDAQALLLSRAEIP